VTGVSRILGGQEVLTHTNGPEERKAMKRIILVVASVVCAIGALLVASPAYATSGGGCSPADDNGDNTVVVACISVSGSNLKPDFYVNFLGRCGSFGVYVRDVTNNRTHAGTWSSGCYTGHHGPWTAGLVRGNKYVTVVILNYNNQFWGRWDSPVQTA
jgi:hypothetical protein